MTGRTMGSKVWHGYVPNLLKSYMGNREITKLYKWLPARCNMLQLNGFLSCTSAICGFAHASRRSRSEVPGSGIIRMQWGHFWSSAVTVQKNQKRNTPVLLHVCSAPPRPLKGRDKTHRGASIGWPFIHRSTRARFSGSGRRYIN